MGDIMIKVKTKLKDLIKVQMTHYESKTNNLYISCSLILSLIVVQF